MGATEKQLRFARQSSYDPREELLTPGRSYSCTIDLGTRVRNSIGFPIDVSVLDELQWVNVLFIQLNIPLIFPV